MQIFSKEELDAFKAEAARVLSEAETKAAAKAAADLKLLKELAAPYPAKERRAYLDRKRTEMQAYFIKQRHPVIDLHYTERATLLRLLALQLEDYAAGRSQRPAAALINRLSSLEAARLNAQALAAELEGAKASSAEGMNDSETAEKARELLSKMKMLDSRGKLCQPLDCEHDLTTIARALYRALENEMKGNTKDEQFSQILKNEFGHSILARTLRGNSTVRDKQKAERTLSEAFKALI